MSNRQELATELRTALATLDIPVSADLRDHASDIPAIIYAISDDEYTRSAAASGPPIFSSVIITALSMSRLDAETLALGVRSAIASSTLNASHIAVDADTFTRGSDSTPVYTSSSTYTIVSTQDQTPAG